MTSKATAKMQSHSSDKKNKPAIKNSKPNLASVTIDEIETWASQEKIPAYRTKQIIDWIYSRRTLEPNKMLNLPKDLRQALSESFTCSSSSIIERNGDEGEVRKLLIKLHDGELIESVIIPAEERLTFCLSTQIGCPVGCHFCASGAKGLKRNLSSGEIMEQFFLTCSVVERLPDNIVFMGIGEGLLNYDNLATSLHLLSDERYIGLACRRLTVSTSGWVPGIKRLAEEKKPWNLAVSLHAPDDLTRAKLIPDRFRHNISDIVDACVTYREKTGRMLTFEYVLISKINDRPEQAAKLANLAKHCRAKINLIPYNQVENSTFSRPTKRVIAEFTAVLRARKAQFTLRLEKGSDINAACGQLRAARD